MTVSMALEVINSRANYSRLAVFGTIHLYSIVSIPNIGKHPLTYPI